MISHLTSNIASLCLHISSLCLYMASLCLHIADLFFWLVMLASFEREAMTENSVKMAAASLDIRVERKVSSWLVGWLVGAVVTNDQPSYFQPTREMAHSIPFERWHNSNGHR